MLRFCFILGVIIQLCLAKPWFGSSSETSEENWSEFEETIDKWITRSERNERKIKTLQYQIEDISDVLEDQSEMIGRLEDLVSFGRRRFDENQMMIGENEENLEVNGQEPMPMQSNVEEENVEEESNEEENTEENTEENNEENIDESEEIEKHDDDGELKEETFAESEESEEVEGTE